MMLRFGLRAGLIGTFFSGLLMLTALLIGRVFPAWVLIFSANHGSTWTIEAFDVERAIAQPLYAQFTFQHQPIPSVDGRYVVLITVDGDLRVLDSDTKAEHILTENVSLAAIAWSPVLPNRLLYQGIAGRVYVVTFASDGMMSEPILLSIGSTLDARGFRWSPDGTRIVFERRFQQTGARYMYEIYAMQADGSNLHNITALGDRHEYSPVWSPDGEAVAFLSDFGAFTEIHVQQNGTIQPLIDHGIAANSGALSWSPDGTHIAYATFPLDATGVFVASITETRQVQVFNNRPVSPIILWSPDSERLAFVAVGGRLIIAHADGSQRRRLWVNNGLTILVR